ncbi:MAG: class I SAM-dependent methyltransferase [Actinomycetota bacterium]|nr:class I SAM-dependent methyltransferase [Actinomycetota bacterium]
MKGTGQGDAVSRDDVAAQTRQLYAGIHERQITEETSTRLPGYLELIDLDVTGLNCLDLGAGSTARDAIRLISAGAASVALVDVGDAWMTTARAELERHGIPAERYSLVDATGWMAGDDGSRYDLITCSGVLHHMEDPDSALTNVNMRLRPDGHFYLMVIGKGGLVRDFVMHTMRDLYASDSGFRSFMDGDPDAMLGTIRAGLHGLAVDRDRPLPAAYAQLLDLLSGGLDVDLMLTLKDRVNSPIYHEYDLAMATHLLESHGLRIVQRVYTAPQFTNIRAILEPVYSHPERPISRLLMGSGDLHLLATKAGRPH